MKGGKSKIHREPFCYKNYGFQPEQICSLCHWSYGCEKETVDNNKSE